jgi:hypothetical protein
MTVSVFTERCRMVAPDRRNDPALVLSAASGWIGRSSAATGAIVQYRVDNA